MSFLTGDPQVQGMDVRVSHEEISVDLNDGRTIIVPLGWYPRLARGTLKERKHWRLIGKGEGIHWTDLDEDLSVQNLLLGKPSGESQTSLQKWIDHRSARKKPASRRGKRKETHGQDS